MKQIASIALALGLLGASADAQVMLDDTFAAESPAGSTLNYNAFTNWDVTGQVDLVRMPNGFGISCNIACVDLDGSSGPGSIRTKQSFALGAGERWTFAFYISGSQRSSAADDIGAAVRLSGGANTGNFTGTGGMSFLNVAGPSGFSAVTGNTSIAGFAPFSWWSISFDVFGAGSAQFELSTASGDNIGPIIDQVIISKSSPAVVPEPATLALVLLGLGAMAARHRGSRIVNG